MLYGYFREPGPTTVVTAAIFKSVLADFLKRASERPDLYVSMEEPDFMTIMTDEEFQKFKSEVTVFQHASVEQQQEFVDYFNLLICPFHTAVHRQKEMLEADEPDPYDASDERTLEEIYGLTEHDPFDQRTDEQKEQDAAFKEAIKQARKDGQISDESFKPREKKGKNVHVTDVRAHTDADGNVQIDRILAVKDNDESEHEVQAQEAAPTEPNATLTLTFGPDVKETRRVVWHGRSITGAEDLIQAVHVDDLHKEQFRAGFQPDFMIEADTGQITRAHYEIIIGELVCEHLYGEQSA